MTHRPSPKFFRNRRTDTPPRSLLAASRCRASYLGTWLLVHTHLDYLYLAPADLNARLPIIYLLSRWMSPSTSCHYNTPQPEPIHTHPHHLTPERLGYYYLGLALPNLPLQKTYLVPAGTSSTPRRHQPNPRHLPSVCSVCKQDWTL